MGRLPRNLSMFTFYLTVIISQQRFLSLLASDWVNFPFITDAFSVTKYTRVDTSSLLHLGAFPDKAVSISKLSSATFLS